MQVVNYFECNKIYNCLGLFNLLLIDIGGLVNLELGDVVMLCFDGLWGSVQEDELIDICISFLVMQVIFELIVCVLCNVGDMVDNIIVIFMMWELDVVIIMQDLVQIDIFFLNVFIMFILDVL